MKYVWLVQVFFVTKINLIWPLQGDSNLIYGGDYNFPLSKMSKVCTFLAESCGKCTELKACFWCSENGVGPGSCYARSDKVARQRCIGKVISYWKKPCKEVSENLYTTKDTERKVLIKLLLLLRRLRDSQKNSNNKDNANEKAWHKDKSSLSKLQGSTLPMDFDLENNKMTNKVTNSSTYPHMQNTAQNTSLIEGHVKNSIRLNQSNTQHEDVSIYAVPHLNASTTMATHKPRNNTIVDHNRYNTSLLCIMNNQISCAHKYFCSWCDNNSCCASAEETQLKESTVKVVLPERIQENETTVVCSAMENCETCVPDITCYWCQQTSSCRKYPGQSYVNEECKGTLHHMTCRQQIPVYAIAIWIMLATFFVSVGYICVRKCYYFQLKPVEVKLEERPILFKQKNGRTVYQITESEEEDEELMSRTGKDSYTPSKVGAAPNNPVW